MDYEGYAYSEQNVVCNTICLVARPVVVDKTNVTTYHMFDADVHTDVVADHVWYSVLLFRIYLELSSLYKVTN